MRSAMRAFAVLTIVSLSVLGCAQPGFFSRGIVMPNELTHEQLVFHSDYKNADQQRLFDELIGLRQEILAAFALPASKDPINVYVFGDEDKYRHYTRKKFPDFPERRAFFVENDDGLQVYAYWGDYALEDLRHEVTHGYLHSVAPRVPLWLDEGIAEFYEVGDHRNMPHVEQLAGRLMQGGWRPNLARLEGMTAVSDMEQIDYAESWAWVHFLLTTTEERRALLQRHIRAIRADGSDRPLAVQLRELTSQPEEELMAHVMSLAPRPH